MSTAVEVAFVGRDVGELLPLEDFDFDNPFFDEDQNTRSWNERKRVSLSVENDERLVNIFDRAVRLAGVTEFDWTKHRGEIHYGTYRFMALRDDGSPIPLVHRLTDRPVLTDRDGLARWGAGLYGHTTYAELRVAANLGAISGDPTQVYLNIRPAPAGGELFVEWELVLQLWEIAFHVAEALAATAGTIQLYREVRDRLRGYQVVERKTGDWLKRNGHYDLIREMLRGEPWSPRNLAGLLGCTTDEAESILALFGYERESSERWIYVGGDVALGLKVGDVSARVVKAFTNEARNIYAAEISAPPEEVEALFRKVVEQALETGDVGGLRSDDALRRRGRPD